MMKKKNNLSRVIYGVLAGAFILTGCTGNPAGENRASEEERTGTLENVEAKEAGMEESKTEESKTQEARTEEACLDISPETDTEKPAGNATAEAEIIDMDWSGYFEGLNGSAVVYDVAAGRYLIYNREDALTRSSPCSTFKIVSSLIALENGILEPEHSVRSWSGEAFWNENWNRDIDFPEAFRTSCVWYYRELIDDIGRERMQEELDRLGYGNCDISDWEGRLNTNNNNRALAGFWIESSLLISPKEQTEVMERIFGEQSDYSEKTRNELKAVMLVSEPDATDFPIYGKTGMGKAEGILVDAWFAGFAQSAEGNVYFCVHFGKAEQQNDAVSSAAARETAIRIISDYCAVGKA